jgi:hypothetical protein
MSFLEEGFDDLEYARCIVEGDTELTTRIRSCS